MSLRDLREVLLDYVKDNEDYIKYNENILDIYRGNLKPHVVHKLKASLGQNYFEQIKHRIIPINILKRITDKAAKTYSNKPQRIVEEKYDDFVSYYEDVLQIDRVANLADEFQNLFKGFLFEPFLYKGVPKLRVVPFDRFLPWSNDEVDPTIPTVIIKFMGERLVRNKINNKMEMKEIFYTYTNEEFDAFDINGDDYLPALEQTEGINPLGVLPCQYANRMEMQELLPTLDTDTYDMVTAIPVSFTDIGGALMFQAFSVIWGLDVEIAENGLKMSPNAFWDLKSDPTTDKTPQVGTITPQVDSTKSLEFVRSMISSWLQSKGIKAGGLGSADSENLASGVAKLIDEMDTFEIRKVSMEFFKQEEKKLWELIRVYHNYWVTTDPDLDPYARSLGLIGDDFEVNVIFDEPKPMVDRKEEIETIQLEMEAGLLPLRPALERAYPDLSSDQIDERIMQLEEGKVLTLSMEDFNGMDAREDRNTQEPQQDSA